MRPPITSVPISDWIDAVSGATSSHKVFEALRGDPTQLYGTLCEGLKGLTLFVDIIFQWRLTPPTVLNLGSWVELRPLKNTQHWVLTAYTIELHHWTAPLNYTIEEPRSFTFRLARRVGSKDAVTKENVPNWLPTHSPMKERDRYHTMLGFVTLECEVK